MWQTIYRGNTQIEKLRRGNDIPSAINKWKETLQNPNLKREVNVVVDFISKSGLKDRLIRLRNGEDFKEKNEIIQILWFVSSLISSCVVLMVVNMAHAEEVQIVPPVKIVIIVDIATAEEVVESVEKDPNHTINLSPKKRKNIILLEKRNQI